MVLCVSSWLTNISWHQNIYVFNPSIQVKVDLVCVYIWILFLRWIYYELYLQKDEKTSSYEEITNRHSVIHIDIGNREGIDNYRNYFPNVIELTLSDEAICQDKVFLPIIATRIFPLKQLTKLNIKICTYHLKDLIELLRLTPKHWYIDNWLSIQTQNRFSIISIKWKFSISIEYK
jgi:hypothetical protein